MFVGRLANGTIVRQVNSSRTNSIKYNFTEVPATATSRDATTGAITAGTTYFSIIYNTNQTVATGQTVTATGGANSTTVTFRPTTGTAVTNTNSPTVPKVSTTGEDYYDVFQESELCA